MNSPIPKKNAGQPSQVAGRWRKALQLLVSCAQRALRCDEATLLGATTAAGRRWRKAVLVMKTFELREMKPATWRSYGSVC